ncbi:sensor histidine kinase [Actinomyces sp. 2119]|uniref:Sensor histidine kinase MtrB n=1 Tax=Actinomyces lilanjuaniae TaxID=2321394 RepID=A0ABN5PSV1_9ACTO|nr:MULTISPECIES: MtrAB system histidine kinase MtrB [Actinomyces]AYD90229.1 sensor histidine kinase [Actinomyces lilanjuaniae]RJF41492.1 sensor histidine kinase [Actinomyces sp. 2119]
MNPARPQADDIQERTSRTVPLPGFLRRSLELRMVFAASLIGLLLIILLLSFVTDRIRSEVFEDQRSTILADAGQRALAAQVEFDSATAVTADEVSAAAEEQVNDVNDSFAASGGVGVIMRRSAAETSPTVINDLETDTRLASLVSPQMEAAVEEGGVGAQYWQSVAVPDNQGGADPGIIVGTRVSLPLAGDYDLYLVYSLAGEQRVVSLASRNITIGGLGFLVMLILVVWAITRWVISPVRHTARAAERLASGELSERLNVQGEDEIATLARSFNHMAASLEDQIERLEALSKVQQLFVSDVSHELRTPLASIRLATEQIEDARTEISDPFALRSVEVLSQSVDRFEKMLTDLLDISRIDSGNVKLRLEEVDLAQVIDSVVETTRFHFDATGTELRLHLPQEAATAEVDVTRVERIIRNLVVNALEHGEGKPLDLTLAVDDEAVAIRVRDHGIGMSPDVVAKVFDRFYRADPSRQRSLGGTGLGLSISMEDAILHGGRLSAWGWPADGSSFLLVLPRHQGEDGGPGRLSGAGPLDLVPDDAPQVSRAGSADASADAGSTSLVSPLGPAPATRRTRPLVVLGDIPLAGEDTPVPDLGATGRVVVVLPGEEASQPTPDEAAEGTGR